MTTTDKFAGCKVCHYATRIELLDNRHICPACCSRRSSTATWSELSRNHSGHEARIKHYESRAAKKLPLFGDA